MTLSTDLVRPFMPDEISAEIVRAFYEKIPILQYCQANGLIEDFAGRGMSYKYTVNVGATTNNAAAVSEDGVLPSPNVSTMAEASHSLATYAATAKITKEAEVAGVGVAMEEFAQRSRELANTVEAGLATALEAAFGTAAYGGLTRASYAAWGTRAGAATHSGTEALSQLQAAIEAVETTNANGKPAIPRDNLEIWVGSTSYYDYCALLTPSTSHVQGYAGAFDDMGTGVVYNGIPIRHIPSMTATTAIVFAPSFIRVPRAWDVQVEESASSNLSKLYKLSWRGTLVHKLPSAGYLITNS